MSRSPLSYSLPKDSDRIPASGAVLASDGISVRPLELDGSGNLLVNVAVGGGSGGGSVTQGTSPWVDNVTQFGGNNIVTGTGIGGLGIPRVTVSSDSFPTTQAISATSLPLPTGAATSANQSTEITSLSSIVTNTTGLATSANQTNGNQQIQGNVASGLSDLGNAVKIGAVFNTTLPTYTNGQRGDAQMGSRGAILVQLAAPSGTLQASVVGSGDSMASQTGLASINFVEIYNGSSYDRLRSANSVSGTTGTGLLGVGQMTWDGTNWQKFPAATFAPSTTALNTYSIHLTANATTTPTASTAYISSITISNEVGGTTSTITIQDKQGTPLKLVNGIATTALTTAPTVVNFQTPVKMVSGIDIITAGAVAATVDVWVNYYQ